MTDEQMISSLKELLIKDIQSWTPDQLQTAIKLLYHKRIVIDTLQEFFTAVNQSDTIPDEATIILSGDMKDVFLKRKFTSDEAIKENEKVLNSYGFATIGKDIFKLS